MPAEYRCYVALGDSATEGLNDGDPVHGYRGWADRLAEQLAQVNPELRYANLAVRGRRAAQVRAEQLQPALSLEPDFVTVVAGMNDLIRPKCDVEDVLGHIEAMFDTLRATGAHVLTMTLPDIGRVVPIARLFRSRLLAYNAGIRELGRNHRVTVVDLNRYEVGCDLRLWSSDRLHCNSLGHARIAAAMAAVLDLPGSDESWALPLPPAPPIPLRRLVRTEARWATSFFAPWIIRRLRGRSSGDGRTAKRPLAEPWVR